MRRGFALLPPLVLGACAADPGETAAALRAATEATRQAAAMLPTAVPPPPPTRGGAAMPMARPDPALHAVAFSPPPPAAAPTLNYAGPVAALVGRTPAEIERMLGPPSLRRRDGPAETWMYQGAGCVVDIVFYREDGPDPRVGHAAARPHATACVRGQTAARPGRPS